MYLHYRLKFFPMEDKTLFSYIDNIMTIDDLGISRRGIGVVHPDSGSPGNCTRKVYKILRNRGQIQYCMRRLIARSHKFSKPRHRWLGFSHCSEIWQGSQQHFNARSRALKTCEMRVRAHLRECGSVNVVFILFYSRTITPAANVFCWLYPTLNMTYRGFF